ncbi:MAG: hypothetical protein AB8I08_27450 [Sandaracinaceae bacterium]
MMEFFRAGGWSMLVVLGSGGLTFATAVWMMVRPQPGHVGMVRSFSTATVFAVATGVASNLAAVFHHVASNDAWAHSPDLALIVMTGLAESLTPAVMGGGLLTVAWLTTGVAVRRLGVEAEPALHAPD